MVYSGISQSGPASTWAMGYNQPCPWPLRLLFTSMKSRSTTRYSPVRKACVDSACLEFSKGYVPTFWMIHSHSDRVGMNIKTAFDALLEPTWNTPKDFLSLCPCKMSKTIRRSRDHEVDRQGRTNNSFISKDSLLLPTVNFLPEEALAYPSFLFSINVRG